MAPIHVSSTRVDAVLQNRVLWVGFIFLDCVSFLAPIGAMMTSTDAANATTPPTFDGIDRRTA